MIYAGITLYPFKYFVILKQIVKILRVKSESAGSNSVETSETLRNGIVINLEKIRLISEHRPVHLKPLNNKELGYYLAGIIDGNGHFNNKQELVIVFNLLDIQLAYFLKKEIGYGTVKKIMDKNAVLLIISDNKGIEKVICLINGKFRSVLKFDEISENILSNEKYFHFSKSVVLSLNLDNSIENYWLAGFSDVNANVEFQINFINKNNRLEVQLNYQINQEKDYLLILIKNYLGGHIGYKKNEDTYYYDSVNYGSAKKVINYYDRYHLQSTKYINYLKWRKTYLLIQNKRHLTKLGIVKIEKLKNSMNRYLNITI